MSLPPPEVSVSQPVERQLSDYFDTTGRAAAVESVDIRARVAGYLMKVGFEDGQLVKAGDVLFEIDARPYEAAVMQAEGELGRWRASLKKAEADADRTQRLLAKGASSEKDFETAVADRDRSKAEIQAAEAKLAQAKLDLGEFRWSPTSCCSCATCSTAASTWCRSGRAHASGRSGSSQGRGRPCPSPGSRSASG